MAKLMARVAVAVALVGLAAPAFPCDAMRSTTASAPQKAEKDKKAAEQKAKKSEKSEAKPTVASNEKK